MHNPARDNAADDLTGIFDNTDPDDLLRPSDILGSTLSPDTLWRPYASHHNTRVTHRGDLILHADDLHMPAEVAQDLVRTWAGVKRFSLDGLDELAVWEHLIHTTLHPAIRTTAGCRDVVRTVRVDRLRHPASQAPDLRIIINGDLAMIRAALHFDGPFRSDDHALDAVTQRLAHFA